mmetsp:Transcript_102703/g.299610  ORF Transcript_102703/g.299610 Transcript_102703/m.299610 type:complete len:382 (-) Transcript_102703:368-1513(-)
MSRSTKGRQCTEFATGLRRSHGAATSVDCHRRDLHSHRADLNDIFEDLHALHDRRWPRLGRLLRRDAVHGAPEHPRAARGAVGPLRLRKPHQAAVGEGPPPAAGLLALRLADEAPHGPHAHERLGLRVVRLAAARADGGRAPLAEVHALVHSPQVLVREVALHGVVAIAAAAARLLCDLAPPAHGGPLRLLASGAPSLQALGEEPLALPRLLPVVLGLHQAMLRAVLLRCRGRLPASTAESGEVVALLVGEGVAPALLACPEGVVLDRHAASVTEADAVTHHHHHGDELLKVQIAAAVCIEPSPEQGELLVVHLEVVDLLEKRPELCPRDAAAFIRVDCHKLFPPLLLRVWGQIHGELLGHLLGLLAECRLVLQKSRQSLP